MLLPLMMNGLNLDSATVVAVVSGTIIGATETDIVAGGKTIVVTITNDTWVATVGLDNLITTGIINGLVSAQSEANGWNNVVQAGLTFADVTRDSDTQITILLPAFANYLITDNEVITVNVPSTAIASATKDIDGTPLITIEDTGRVLRGGFKRRSKPRRYVIEVDGKYFEVNNVAEAQTIFQKIRDIAAEQVETLEPLKPVRIKVTTGAGKESRQSTILSDIRTTKLAVDKAIERQEAYLAKQQQIDGEIHNLMLRAIENEEDDEDAILALLLS